MQTIGKGSAAIASDLPCTYARYPMQTPTEPSALDSLGESIANLEWVDLAALAILVVFFILGLFKGLVWQASRVAILALAYLFAGIYGESLAELTSTWFAIDVAPELPLYLSWFLIFLSVLVTVSLIAYFLQKMIQASGLSFYNRIGGGFLGIATGGLVVLALLTVMHMVYAGLGAGASVVQAADRSHSSRISHGILDFASDVLPEDWRGLPRRWQELLNEDPAAVIVQESAGTTGK